MIILITAIILILLTYILINYVNNQKKKSENFMVLYDDLNEYLLKNIDNDIMRDSYCFDNDKLISKIKGDPNLTCASHYEDVSDIHYKFTYDKEIDTQYNTADEKYNGLSEGQERDNSFYDVDSKKSYSFAELCPITSKQLNSTLCLRKHNNDISDTMFRLDNILTDTELVLRNNLSDIYDTLSTYRNDRYRLFNSSDVQDYVVNNDI